MKPKATNGRIEIVSDHEINIVGKIQSSLVIDCHGFSMTEFATGDRDAALALRDAINCYVDTYSFAALAETSAVPYLGKQVLHGGEVQTVVRVTRDDDVTVMVGSCATTTSANYLKPLVSPEPVYRQFTYAEAAEYFGKRGEFTVYGPTTKRTVMAVGLSGFITTDNTWLTFHGAVDWRIDGIQRCGVLIK